MENNEYAKQQFFKRIIIAKAKLVEPVSKDLISLALQDNYPEEFNCVKALTAYTILCWNEIRSVQDSRCMDYLRRTFDSLNSAELKMVIEEFMEYTEFPDGWLEGWPYEESH